jgi:sugar lactone lactonase YvrE
MSARRLRTVLLAALIAVAGAVVAVRIVTGSPSSAAAGTSTAALYAEAPGARTLAGTGSPGSAGEGTPAATAELDSPGGIAEDGAGDLFIADSGNCRVVEVPAADGHAYGTTEKAGDLVTLAGGSCRGGHDPAPGALALDGSGDLFVVYPSANTIEEIPKSNGSRLGRPVIAGRPVVVAGSGALGFAGDGGPAVAASLDDPTGVAVDSAGDVFVADTANSRVRMVAGSSGVRFGMPVVAGDIYTVAGDGLTGSAGDGGPALDANVWDPGALAVDSAGDVFLADQGNRTIRVLAAHSGNFLGVPLATGDIGTVAGEGSYGPYLIDGLPAVGETAELNFPTAIVVDNAGNIYVADGDMHAIRFVAASDTVLRGKVTSAGNMYTAAGALSVGTLRNTTSWIQTRLLDPTGVALSPSGRLVYADGGANVVRELPAGA